MKCSQSIIKISRQQQTSPSSLNSNKRPNPTDNSDMEICGTENDPIIAIGGGGVSGSASKKQRTKSGEDDALSEIYTDLTSKIEGVIIPLSERNLQNVADMAHGAGLSGGELAKRDLIPVMSASPIASDKLDADYLPTQNGCLNMDSHLVNINITNGGGSSPYCAATLEYVTRLPEGYSRAVHPAALDQPIIYLDDAENELEDDDNYLDSTDEEETDLTTSVNDDEESCGEDDQSVVSTITVGSTCSLRSVASDSLSSLYLNEHGLAANEDGSLLYSEQPSMDPVPPLKPSLFSHVPPSINFCQYNETVAELPDAAGRLLKWRLTNITPLIVKKTLANSGFKMTRKTVQWIGTWGKHMKSPCFRTIREYQKINHFPGTFQIGRKDKLWKNFVRLQAKFGKEEFGFMPKTFVIPADLKSLKCAFEKEGVKKKWIVKPPASARGLGIQVVDKWSQIATETPLVVQRYISRPYLINDTKFDIRIYVLVTSFHPLRIYLYQDGLVRFASVQYNKNSKNLHDRFMHLTNYSVNKSSAAYTHNEDAAQCQGHKWTLKALWGYLNAREIDTAALWSRIADLVIKTIISGENDIVARTRRNLKSRYSSHELFGFDVILDEKLRPWLLEVNISPSLHSASPLDHSVKGPLIADLLNVVTYHIPDKLTHLQQAAVLDHLGLSGKVSTLCLDRRLYTKLLSPDELMKHQQTSDVPRNQYLSAILDYLTPDDVRHLISGEDELARAGKFTCIFPTVDTYQYFGIMGTPRYYNCLMDAWETMYATCRDKGIEHLESLCQEKHHLKVPPTFRMPKVAVSSKTKGSSRTPLNQTGKIRKRLGVKTARPAVVTHFLSVVGLAERSMDREDLSEDDPIPQEECGEDVVREIDLTRIHADNETESEVKCVTETPVNCELVQCVSEVNSHDDKIEKINGLIELDENGQQCPEVHKNGQQCPEVNENGQQCPEVHDS